VPIVAGLHHAYKDRLDCVKEDPPVLEEGMVYLGASQNPDDSIGKAEYLALKLANRHGLVTGATGTGKTVTLQILTEGFSAAGVPVFAADVKGDLSGLAVAGGGKDFLIKRAGQIGFADEYTFESFPVVFWDLFGEQGHPIRTTISDMGPLLLSRLMSLSDVQEGVLNIAFKIADDEGLLLLDLRDLQALLANLSERSAEISGVYGNVSKSSVGAIQRQLLVLEQQGGESFFGEPALDIMDLMRTTRDGRGVIDILAADKLMMAPQLYATFLLWLLSELFGELPEIGNRVQHALRAYTLRERKAVKTAADTFRPNPDFNAFEVITQLGVGEALVSTLEKRGVPSIVQRTLIRPPSSRLGPISQEERRKAIKQSPLFGRYDKAIDRESAFEILKKRAADKAGAEEAQRAREDAERQETGRMRRPRTGFQFPGFGRDDRPTRRSRVRSTTRRRRSRRQSVAQTAIKQVARTLASQLGRTLIRGVLGSLKRGG